MNYKTLIDFVGWGFILWLVGYVLGFIAFFFVDVSMIGWVVGPPLLALTVVVLWKQTNAYAFPASFLLGVVWSAMAIVLDYYLLVSLFAQDGYYKLDVYLYYALMLVLPPVVLEVRRRRDRASAIK